MMRTLAVLRICRCLVAIYKSESRTETFSVAYLISLKEKKSYIHILILPYVTLCFQ